MALPVWNKTSSLQLWAGPASLCCGCQCSANVRSYWMDWKAAWRSVLQMCPSIHVSSCKDCMDDYTFEWVTELFNTSCQWYTWFKNTGNEALAWKHVSGSTFGEIQNESSLFFTTVSSELLSKVLVKKWLCWMLTFGFNLCNCAGFQMVLSII